MSGITLDRAKKHLDAWLEADLAVSTSQSYNMGGRQITRADSDEIRANIKYWSDIVKQLEVVGSGIRFSQAVPL